MATKTISPRIIITDENQGGIVIIETDAHGHPVKTIILDAEEAIAINRWLD